MSAWFYEPEIPSNFTAAGGVAGLGDIVDAAQKQMRLVDNTNSSYAALYQAYDDRIAAIHAVTGQRVENPLKLAEQEDFETMRQPRRPAWQTDPFAELKQGPRMPTATDRERQKFSTWLKQMESQFPDKADAIRAGVPLERDAEALAKKADEDLARQLGSRAGIMGFAAAFAGGFKGSLSDPLQAATLAIGGGAGTGRTVLARIANVALKEALINGAVEASLQPTVQAWRLKVGLPHGFDEGLRNTMFAAAAGGLFGAGGEAIGAAARRLFTGDMLDRAAEEAAKTATLTPEIRAGLAGDAGKAIDALRPIRDALPPEARAAIDLHETLSALPVPEGARPDLHARNSDAAIRAALEPEARAFEPEIDRAKIERIVRELVPDAPPPRRTETASLTDFLIRAGGLQDQKGEISALGLQNTSARFKGRLVREDGRPLDAARALAAEAGYFDHRYGTPEKAVEKSTVADLLDELDHDQRRASQPLEDDGGRRYAEARVSELLAQVGPDVDERLIGRAVKLAEAEKIDLVEAFDRVAIAEERALPDEIAADIDAARKMAERYSDPLSLAQAAVERGDAIFDELSDLRVSVTTIERKLKKKYHAKSMGELDDAPLTEQERNFLFYDRLPLSREEIDRLSDIRAPVDNLDEAATELRMLLRSLPDHANYDAMTDLEKEAMARLFFLASEIERLGFDFKDVLREAVEKYVAGIGDPSDRIFLMEDILSRLSRFIEGPPTPRAPIAAIEDLSAPRRADPLMPEQAATEPELAADDEMFTPADLEGLDAETDIPFFDDGRASTPQQVIDNIEELDFLFQVTEACKA